MIWFLVALGGLAGAPCRYLVDRAISGGRPDRHVPWGTLVINVSGSALLGAMAAVTAQRGLLYAAIGTGFCGSFTTFSTFAWETFALFEDGLSLVAGINLGLTLGLGLAAAGVAYAALN